MDLEQEVFDMTIVAFDTETSGAMPIGSDIVEFGAVKWQNGKIIDQFQTLLKPREPMSDFIIGIHGITNEMVENAPLMKDKILEIEKFMEDSLVMAHHAPFDQGFLAYELEKHGRPLPQSPVLCTSLLSRKLIEGTVNHKLQTLVEFLKIDGGAAHRALDDAKSCLYVGLESLKKIGESVTLRQAFQVQEKNLSWSNYSIFQCRYVYMPKLVQAIQGKKDIDFIYDKGPKKNQTRRATPLGVVRNPDGDYLNAFCKIDQQNKRFYLSTIKELEVVS